MCTFCIHFSSKCFLQNEYFINVNKVYNVMYTSMFEFVYILYDTFFWIRQIQFGDKIYSVLLGIFISKHFQKNNILNSRYATKLTK